MARHSTGLRLLLCAACISGLAELPATALAGKQKGKPADARKQTPASAATAPDSMALHGGEEGTTFKSLRIEGEDRVRIEFERPQLHLELDPRQAPGLVWEGVNAALNRGGVDLVDPFLDRTAGERPPLFARPWFGSFTEGGVARFRPAIESVARWKLIVADSKGKTVANFEGKGKPPKEITWEGRSLDGTFVPPGLTYSYVLEAYDEAGNKRNFVGPGFEIPSYLVSTPGSLVMLFSGDRLASSTDRASPLPLPSILLEAASWINQRAAANEAVRVEVSARSIEDATRMADDLVGDLSTLLLGSPARIQAVTHVDPQAPEGGTVAIVVAAGSEAPR